jgi:hypothetical protein
LAKLSIGLRQARRLCQMAPKERLVFIAEGLPIILESAQGFWNAVEHLDQRPREAAVLEGFAEEEAAKILILMDIVRCPPGLVASKIGHLVDRFYDHLARLLYATAQTWKPMHTSQLRDYVDEQRRAYYLEGDYGEWITPNWIIARRESTLYADIEAYEDGIPNWSRPTANSYRFGRRKPVALQVAESLSMVGAYNLKGLQIASDIWGAMEFKDSESPQDSERLTLRFLEELITEKLPSDEASDENVATLYNYWQMPMYNLNFKMTEVQLTDLEQARDSLRWQVYGCYENNY